MPQTIWVAAYTPPLSGNAHIYGIQTPHFKISLTCSSLYSLKMFTLFLLRSLPPLHLNISSQSTNIFLLCFSTRDDIFPFPSSSSKCIPKKIYPLFFLLYIFSSSDQKRKTVEEFCTCSLSSIILFCLPRSSSSFQVLSSFSISLMNRFFPPFPFPTLSSYSVSLKCFPNVFLLFLLCF